jgi:hypothetical protein
MDIDRELAVLAVACKPVSPNGIPAMREICRECRRFEASLRQTAVKFVKHFWVLARKFPKVQNRENIC